MSFGSIGRNFQSRIDLAGTYDQKWLDDVFPFLPSDFNSGYYQSAPVDQQIEYPKGGEKVNMKNITSDGYRQFALPQIEVPVEFTNKKNERTRKEAVIDTILFEPEENRFVCIGRTSQPLKKNMLEMTQVVVGKMSRAWYRARQTGKTYYKSLDQLIRSKKEEIVGE